MAQMDVSGLKRLKEEQEKALIQTDNEIEQWKKIQSDYVAVQERLRTLPNKITHNVMVPFGSLAFMPGQLVHTNEVLALLGDNYFVECSATHAVDIVSRRLQGLDKNIQGLAKQREMLVPRTEFTSEMIEAASGEGDRQEIVEKYDEEQERQWRERHREYLREAGRKKMKEMEEKEEQRKKEKVKTDADYWDILDKLEQQESQNKELDRMEGNYKQEQSRVIAKDVEEEESSSLNDSDPAEDEDEDVTDDEEEDMLQARKTITFSHTKQNAESSGADVIARSEDDTDVINSPADLYRLIKTGPKSILKSPSKHTNSPRKRLERRRSQEEQEKKVTFGGEQTDGRSAHGVNTFPGESAEAGVGVSGYEDSQHESLGFRPDVEAFKAQVEERDTSDVCISLPEDNSTSLSTVPGRQDTSSSSRPVSKFRAGRQKSDTAAIVSSSKQSQDSADPSDSNAAMQGHNVNNSARPVSKFRSSRVK